MTSDEVNAAYLAKAVAMFPRISGNPCVNVVAETREVQVCHRIYDLSVADSNSPSWMNPGVLYGMCEWREPAENRPDSLTDGLAIGSDLLDVGDDWWLDIYFNWYLVFSPAFVNSSLRGDHSWVEDFLHKTIRNRTIPRPPPSEDTTHLLSDREALQYFG